MSHISRSFLATLIVALPAVASADEPTLKVTPTGRVLIDGALYASPQKSMFPDGVAIPEVRLGADASYGKWKACIQMSYAYSKVGLRDMWISYDFNPQSYVRIGSFIHQFGLQSTSSSQKPTMEEPMAATPFTPGLQLGAMYLRHTPKWFVAASAHVESNALTQVMNAPLFNQQGYSLLSRVVYRHAPADGPVWHVGLSGGFSSPQRRLKDNEDVHDGFTVSAKYPTKVAEVTAVSATVDKSMNLFKFTPEVLFTAGRFAFEGQYFFQQINRRENLQAFRAQSGYATLRGLLIGDSYSYNSASAILANPKPGSLECVLNYNYTTLSDKKAAIFGGRSNSMSVTLNWYINPYVTARLNYSYAHTWDRAGVEPATMNAFQARLMVLF